MLSALSSIQVAFAVSVNLTLEVAKGAGGPSGTFNLSGCAINPTTLLGDGASHSFTATGSCVVTVTVPTDTQISQYRFAFVASLPNEGLVNNKTATFTTCTPGPCSLRTYTANYEPTTFSSTFSRSSWNGGGLPTLTNDTRAQEIFEATGSMSFYYVGLEGCAGANVTGHTNSFSMTSASANLLQKYQMPFMVQVPMDGYATSCGTWATQVVNQYSDLLSYNSTAALCTGGPGSYSCPHSWVRLDDMNLAVQTFNDLVAVKNALVSANSKALQYWQGIDISSIGSDGGTAPGNPSFSGGGEYGQDTIWHFAKSSYCTTNFAGLCTTLAGQVTDTQAVPSATAYTDLSANFGGLSGTSCNDPCFGRYLDNLYVLGLAYAAFNFSQRYNVGHPFLVLPAKPTATNSCPSNSSLYPFPYNTTYIENLGICNNAIVAAAGVDNGNAPTHSIVTSDINKCLAASPNGIPGGFLIGPKWSRNAYADILYYESECAATMVNAPVYDSGAGAVLTPYPSSTLWSIESAFGLIHNRMENVGYKQFPKVAFSGGYGSYPNISNVTLLGGVGVPLAAWFYSNKTGGATVTVSTTMTASTYHLSNKNCEMSVLTMTILLCENSATISLTNIPITCTNYPCWNPVYVFNETTSSLQNVVYSNVRSTATTTNSSALLASFTGPHASSGWLVVNDSQVPARVGNNRTGALTKYPTLTSLNGTLIGESYIGGSWQNKTDQGWFYDSTNHLVYVHYKMGSNVQIIVNNQPDTSTFGTDGTASACATAVTYNLSGLSTGSASDLIFFSQTIKSTIFHSTMPSDTNLLTWNFRSSQVAGDVNGPAAANVSNESTWYAVAAAKLTGDVITAKHSGSAAGCANAFAIKGANTTSPFDSHAGLPYKALSGFVSVAPGSTGITSTAATKQVTANANSPKMFHASGYYLLLYTPSTTSNVAYIACHDTLDCNSAGSWSASATVCTGCVGGGQSPDFSAFYNYANDTVFVVIAGSNGGTTVRWVAGKVSAGVITDFGGAGHVNSFSATFAPVNGQSSSVVVDVAGDLFFAVGTNNAGAFKIEVWKCAGASVGCTPSNVHTAAVGTAAQSPTLVALANGRIGLVNGSGNTNVQEPMWYSSCPSTCAVDGDWSAPVKTTNTHYYMATVSCIQNAAFISSSTVYCGAMDHTSVGVHTEDFVSIADGGASWTETQLDTVSDASIAFSTNAAGGFFVTYCTSTTTCYYQSSIDSGVTWSGQQTLTSTGNNLQLFSIQTPAILQASDSSTALIAVAGGAASPWTIFTYKVTNPLVTTPKVSSVSTSSAADFVFAAFGYYGAVNQAPGTIGGATATAISDGSATAPLNAVEYYITSTTISSSSCSFNLPAYTWVVICDAIKQATPPPVYVPITLSLLEAGPSITTFTLSGGGVTVFSISGDSLQHLIVASPNSIITAMLGPPSPNTRYKATGGTGQFSTLFIPTCGSGTCSAYSNNYAFQVQNTAQACPRSNGNKWDFAPSIPVIGTSVGSSSQTVGTITGTNGGGCGTGSIWSDYGTSFTPASAASVSSTEQWGLSLNSGTHSATTGGNTFISDYARQWQIQFVAQTGGTIFPTTTAFYNDTSSLLLSATNLAGYTFSGWTATSPSITFSSVGVESSSATAGAAGTITANFAATATTSTDTSTQNAGGGGIFHISNSSTILGSIESAATNPYALLFLVGAFLVVVVAAASVSSSRRK